MSVYLTRKFWTEALERALKSAAQAALVAMGQDALEADVFQATAGTVGAAALTFAVVSLLTSLASAKIGPDNSPSLV